MRKAFIDIIRNVDCLTVTTPPLQKLYSRMNDNVRIVPNSIDFNVWEKLPTRYDGDEIRLLYTGASNHHEDWLFIAPVLADLQKEYPKLKIVLVGADWKSVPSGIDYSRVEVNPWVDIDAYPHLLKSLCCDIGIAPISKIDFNDCRSSIKWLEYSALKMATVATRYGPYKRDIQDGVTGLLVEERPDWKAALSRLIEDASYRKQLSNQAFKHCKATYDLNYVVDDWMNVFNSVVGGKTT
jgi:glycosyltransferase involved in cell wall biosynthesis